MKRHSMFGWLVIVAGSAYIALFIFTASLRVVYPYEVEWNEGAVLDHAVRALDGKPIYTTPDLNFSPFVYTPLYYYVTASAMRMFGIGLGAGRMISILATLLTALIVGCIVRRETRSTLFAFAGAALYIAFYHLTGFFYDIVRMDALAIFFVAAGLYAVIFFRRGYIIAAILTALAYFTKQQMIFMLPSVAAGLFFRNRREAWLFSAIALVLIILASVLLDWQTHGWYRYFTMSIPSIKAHEGFSNITALEFFPKWMMGTLGFFTLVLMLGIFLRGRKLREGNTPLYVACFFFALISSDLSFANPGGYQNVLMPLTLTIAILFPICVMWIACALPQWTSVGRVALAIAFLALIYNPLGQTMLLASARQREAGDVFLAKLKTIPGDVWIPFHGYIGTLAGKQSHIHFMAMNDALVPHDTTSTRLQHEIDSAFSTHRFSAIILDEERVYRWDSIAHYRFSSDIFTLPNVFLSRIGEASTRPNFIYLPTP